MKKTEKRTETNAPKRPYIKPQLEKVQLVPEEAVLTNCKIVGGENIGPSGNSCAEGIPAESRCLELGT